MTVSVASAKPLSELSEAERKERHRVLRAKLVDKRTEVHGLPGVHYLWAARGDDNEMIRLDTMGYSLVREPDPAGVKAGTVKPKVQAHGLKDDGTYIMGDVTLMQCAQEDYEFFLLDIEERHENQRNAIQIEFMDSAEKQGVPTFTVDRKKE